MQLEVQASRPLQKAARVAPLGRWYMSGSSCQVEKSVRCLELHVPCSSAGHSQLVVTGFKSAVLGMPRKSWYATCSAVQPVAPNWS
jgi:hypothetical protein